MHVCFRACAPIRTRCVRGTNLDTNCGVARTRSPLIAAQLHSVLGFSPLRNSPLLICICRSFHDTATHVRTRSGCSSEASACAPPPDRQPPAHLVRTRVVVWLAFVSIRPAHCFGSISDQRASELPFGLFFAFLLRCTLVTRHTSN